GESTSRHHRPLLRQFVSGGPIELWGSWHVSPRTRFAEHRLLLDDSSMDFGSRRAARYLPPGIVGNDRPCKQTDGQGDSCRFCGPPPGCCAFPCCHDTLPQIPLRLGVVKKAIGAEATQGLSINTQFSGVDLLFSFRRDLHGNERLGRAAVL